MGSIEEITAARASKAAAGNCIFSLLHPKKAIQ
jgi:hypothetical protein